MESISDIVESDIAENSQVIVSQQLEIEGIHEAVITDYFETLNSGDFEATAHLFAADGVMHPPFEQPIVGPEAIAAYLQKEAQGFLLQPKQGVVAPQADGTREVEVSGKVQTPLFSVNVLWRFILSPEPKILFAKIKLLASPKELLNLRGS